MKIPFIFKSANIKIKTVYLVNTCKIKPEWFITIRQNRFQSKEYYKDEECYFISGGENT